MSDNIYPNLKDMIEAGLELANQQAEFPVEILNTWECKFLSSLEVALAKYDSLTIKQVVKLKQIYDKVRKMPLAKED